MTHPRPPLAVAVEIDGHGAHPAAWRASSEEPSAVFDPAALRRTVLVAENFGFTLATFDDALTQTQASDYAGSLAGRLDGVVRAAFAAPLTSRTGLAPAVAPRGVEPFHLAAQLASLDIATLGRAAWVVTDPTQPELADALDRVVPESPAEREREVSDVVAAVRRLWDSWEDDAVIKDVSSGRYVDRDRIHNVEVEAESFSIKGALITPRPPQGLLPVFASDRVLAPEVADVTLVGGESVADIAARATSARTRGATRVFAEIEVILDSDVLSTDRLAELDAVIGWNGTDALRFVGSASGLLALLEDVGRHVDGVRLHPAVLTQDLPLLGTHVLPRLVTDRVAAAPLLGSTLRASLGLARPANVFARSTASDRSAA